jgi:hypothetical protein
MNKPLELLQSQRVRFSDTLETHELTLKLQAASLNPLDLQFVVDVLPKLMLSGRQELAAKAGQKPQPKAYLHLKTEDTLAAHNLVLNAMAAALILQNQGHLISKEELLLQVKDWARTFGPAAAESTFFALEQIARAREGILAPATEVAI